MLPVIDGGSPPQQRPCVYSVRDLQVPKATRRRMNHSSAWRSAHSIYKSGRPVRLKARVGVALCNAFAGCGSTVRLSRRAAVCLAAWLALVQRYGRATAARKGGRKGARVLGKLGLADCVVAASGQDWTCRVRFSGQSHDAARLRVRMGVCWQRRLRALIRRLVHDARV